FSLHSNPSITLDQPVEGLLRKCHLWVRIAKQREIDVGKKRLRSGHPASHLILPARPVRLRLFGFALDFGIGGLESSRPKTSCGFLLVCRQVVTELSLNQG